MPSTSISYKLEGERIQQTIKAAIDSASRFLDIEKLKAEKAIFDARFVVNRQRLESKFKEPSQTFFWLEWERSHPAEQ